jgi:hypothetical protein
MVNAVYDHIIAIIVIGAVFVGAVVALPAMSFVNIRAVDQQQLRNVALNVFNAMLLDTGEPVDWGSKDPFYMDDPRVKRFGLASAQDSTFYVLDPDKVQRLVESNPLNYINYSRVRELLGLQGYGFGLRIIPPFNVTKEDETPITPTNSPANITGPNKDILQYAVKVKYLDGRPIPNAASLAIIVYTDGKKFNITGPCSNWTDALGVCRDNIKLEFAPTSWTVILRVSVADVATLIVTFGKTPKIIDINMVGDQIILTKPKDPSNAAVNVTSVYAIGEQNLLWLLYEGQGPPYDKFNTGEGSPFRLWPPPNHPTHPNGIFPGLSSYNPTILIFNLETSIKKDDEWKPGYQEIMVAGPYQNLLGYTVFQYGGSPKGGSASVRLQRSVIISGMTYIVELTLWKESP